MDAESVQVVVAAVLSAIGGGGGVAYWARARNGKVEQIHEWMKLLHEGNIARDARRNEQERTWDDRDRRLIDAVEALSRSFDKLSREVVEQRRDLKEALDARP